MSTQMQRRASRAPRPSPRGLSPFRNSDLPAVRVRVSECVNQLGACLMTRLGADGSGASDADGRDDVSRNLQARLAQLGQIAAGLVLVEPDCLPATGAGY